MKSEKGKIITIASSKGGVGKTIFLLNLAGIYQNLEKRVLILDLDFSSGAIALNLNLNPKKNVYQIVEDRNNHRYLDYHDYITSYNEHIDVVASPKDPRQSMKINLKELSFFLDEIKFQYDVILVDTTHGFTKNNILLYDQSYVILYVLTNDFMDIKNTKNFMTVMDDVSDSNIKVILNNAKDPKLNYFSEFDIKTVINHSIDYVISEELHISNITKYILDGQIPTLNSKFSSKKKNSIQKLTKIAEEIIKER